MKSLAEEVHIALRKTGGLNKVLSLRVLSSKLWDEARTEEVNELIEKVDAALNEEVTTKKYEKQLNQEIRKRHRRVFDNTISRSSTILAAWYSLPYKESKEGSVLRETLINLMRTRKVTPSRGGDLTRLDIITTEYLMLGGGVLNEAVTSIKEITDNEFENVSVLYDPASNGAYQKLSDTLEAGRSLQ